MTENANQEQLLKALAQFRTDYDEMRVGAEMAQPSHQMIASVRDQLRADAWANSLTGQGGSADKAQAGYFSVCNERILTDGALSAMFAFEDLSAKIVDVYPRVALQEGFTLGGLEEKEDEVTDYLKPYRLVSTVLDTWIWARLYGGAVLWVIDSNGDDPGTPLDPETTYDRIERLEVIDRRWLLPRTYDKYGQPETYSVVSIGRRRDIVGVIHASRLVRFPGARTEAQAKASWLMGWDYSVLQRPYNALRSEGGVWGGIENLVQEASVSVFKLKGLFSLAASKQRGATLARYGVINAVKGMFRAIVLDADQEEYVPHNQTFAGLADIGDRGIKRVSAAAEIPVSVLCGEAPAGLNATGDSDIRWFNQRVTSEATLIATPAIEEVIRRFVRSNEWPGPKDYEPKVCYPSLWKATEAEEADIYLKTAQADKIYLDAQVVLPEELFLARAREKGWSTEPPSFGEDRRKLRTEALAANPELPSQAEPEPDPEDPNSPEENPEAKTPDPKAPKARADWDEAQHPRAENGEFGPGNGGGHSSDGGGSGGATSHNFGDRSIDDRQISHTFGAHLDHAHFDRLTGVDHAAKLLPGATVKRTVSTSNGVTELRAEVHTEGSTEPALKVTRTYQRPLDPEEPLRVRHEMLVIRNDLKGKGLGSKIVKSQIEEYQKIGGAVISTDAGLDDGRYVWARVGFTPDKAGQDAILAEAKKHFSAKMNDAAATAAANRYRDKIYKLAALKTPDGRKVGEEILRAAPKWSGTLRVPGEGQPSNEAFDHAMKYLGRNK